GLDPGEEVLLREEVVVLAVLLAWPLRTGRRRNGDLQIVARCDQRYYEGALPPPRRAGDDEELRRRPQRCRRPTSSARWRSDSPPTVFDWLMRHWFRNRAALTRPNFGTAISMSKTLAVSTYAGGVRRRC